MDLVEFLTSSSCVLLHAGLTRPGGARGTAGPGRSRQLVSSGHLPPGRLLAPRLGVPGPGHPGRRRWTAQPGSRARAPSTAPGPGPAPAAGQRPSDHARPGGPGRAQPMGWRRPNDPRRREGVGRQAGRARCRAVSSPPLPPGREVSRPGPQCQLAAERVLQPPAPGAKHGCRQGKRRPVAPGSVPAGLGPAAREPPAVHVPS